MRNIYISEHIRSEEVLLPHYDFTVVNSPKLADIHILDGGIDDPINKDVTMIVLHVAPDDPRWANYNAYIVQSAPEVSEVLRYLDPIATAIK